MYLRPKTTIHDLPVEVISHIFKFLSLSDRKAAGQVSKRWNYAYHHPELSENVVVCLNNGKQLKLKCVLNASTKCFNLLIRDSRKLDDTSLFWKNHGKIIKKLTLLNCNMKGKTFTKILKKCKNLESLSVIHCKDFDLPGKTDMKDRKERLKLVRTLRKLKKIDLSYHENLTNNFFVKIVTLAPNLETLLLTGSFIINFDQAPQAGGNYKVSSGHVNYANIIRFLTKKAEKLKYLSFTKTGMDYPGIYQLTRVKNLNLNGLYLKSCQHLTDESVQLICEYQKSLKELDIGCCPELTNASVLAITSNLGNLRVLSIQRNQSITDNGIKELWRLKKLESLNMSGCAMIFDKGIICGLCVHINQNMKELRLNNLRNISENCIIRLMACVPNIIHLDLGYCNLAMTDAALQAIIKNNKSLKTLCLIKCDRLTDAGFTGRGVTAPKAFTKNKRGRLRNRIPLTNTTDLLKTNEQKKEPRHLGKSIKELKRLRSLNLFGCSKITDDSIVEEFDFNDLQTLDLSKSQVTQKGIRSLTINSKSLEKLTLYQCHQINDAGVQHIAKNCNRLREIYISSKNLTQKAENILAKKNLDIFKVYRYFE